MRKKRTDGPLLVALYRDAQSTDHDVRTGGGVADDTIFLVSSSFRVEPKVLTDALLPQTLTDLECQHLEEDLRCVLGSTARDDLGDALFRFLLGVALSDKVPPWSELKSRLVETIKAANALLASIGSSEPHVRARGFLSAAHAVEEVVRPYGLNAKLLNRVISKCEAELEIVAPLASKRGARADVSFRLLMSAIVAVADMSGAELIVGTHMDPHYFEADPTPLLKAAKTILRIARSRAPEAYAWSPYISTDDSFIAVRRIDIFRAKSDRAIIDQLRVAIKARQNAG